MDRYEPRVTLQIDAGLQAEASGRCQLILEGAEPPLPASLMAPKKAASPRWAEALCIFPPPIEPGEQSPAGGAGSNGLSASCGPKPGSRGGALPGEPLFFGLDGC